MLPTLLCTLACLPAAPQEPGALHLQAVPAELTALVAINDVPGVIALGAQNSWYRYLLDGELEELRALFRPAAAGMGLDSHAAELEMAQDVARAIRALSLFVVPAPETPFGLAALAIHASEEREVLARHLEELRGRLAAECTPEATPWRDGLVRLYPDLPIPGDHGLHFTLAIAELDEVLILVGAEGRGDKREAVLRFTKETIDRVLDPELPCVLGNARFLEAREASSLRGESEAGPAPGTGGGTEHLEAFLDVASLTPFIPKDRDPEPVVRELVSSLSSIPWVYFNTSLGEGEETRSMFGFRCDPTTLLGSVIGLARPVPKELLKLMPPDSATVSIGAFDIGGLLDILFDSVERYAPEGSSQKLEAMLALAESQLGLNPVDDVLRAFDGRFAAFQRFSEDAEGASEPQDALVSKLETVILGVHDGASFGLDLEDLLGTLGFDDRVEMQAFEDVEIFSWSDGLPISWVVTDELVAFSGNRADLEHLVRATRSELPCVLDEEPVARALRETEHSALFTVSNTAQVLKMMGDAFDEISTVSMAVPRLEELHRWMSALGSDGALAPELIDRYFDGHMYSSWEVRDGRVWLRSWGR